MNTICVPRKRSSDISFKGFDCLVAVLQDDVSYHPMGVCGLVNYATERMRLHKSPNSGSGENLL